ncbi:MAG: zinc ribbon domain-containing protein [Methanomassiliicoccaceae archaeon]|nr:zinc ribbon domain-containing protein [Methanomassiliicoccaceae archaeon]
MKQKKCPHCGEYVQENSLTCPKCFGEIPRSPQEYVVKEDKKERSGKVPSAAVLLSVIPPFFGLLGLGLIYLHPKNSKGYWFLAAGLLLFLTSLALFYMIRHSGIFSAVFLFGAFVIIALIYVSAAVAALLETVFGSVLKFLKF